MKRDPSEMTLDERRARARRLRRAGHIVDGEPAMPVLERDDLGKGLPEQRTFAVDEVINRREAHRTRRWRP